MGLSKIIAEAFSVITGKKLSKRVIRELYLTGESFGNFCYYQLFGDKIFKRLISRDSEKNAPTHVYDFNGNLLYNMG